MTNFVVSVFLCVVFCFCFVFGFYCALNTQQGGYVRITSLIIIIIFHYCYCYFDGKVTFKIKEACLKFV